MTDTASTRRLVARRLLNGSTDVLSFAAAWAAGTGVDRTLPRSTPGRLALVLGGSLAGALAADELLYAVTRPLRDRLCEPVTSLPGLPATVSEARQALAANTAADAANRAAVRSYTLDLGGGLISNGHLWTGYEDGTAALLLAPGAVLCCRHIGNRAVYELAQAHTPETVEITSLAQLSELLPAGTDLTGSPDDEDRAYPLEQHWHQEPTAAD